jgi:glucoside 3-dehydrogenase (cytochrome c) hitch-hiker subunit
VPESLENPKSPTVNRRSLILGAVFLVGGAAALTRFTRNSVAGGNGTAVLSPEQSVLLEQVVDIIIPATDTPGALGVGVPEFIRQMLADWGSRETRIAMVGVLESIERQAWHKFSRGFLELNGERRLEIVRAVDEAGFARQDAAWRKFKWLVLAGYYNSEIGATQELRYELVPGAWRSCLPLAEVGRASAV